MQELTIEDYIYRELSLEEQKVAIEFVRFLKDNHLTFYKDNCEYWKDKIYYWVKSEDDCVCFISIKNPEEKNNHWTVWSADKWTFKKRWGRYGDTTFKDYGDIVLETFLKGSRL